MHVASPDGGFYLFPQFGEHRETLAQRDVTTSAELCERLLEDTGVALLPGAPFGRPAGELSARLSYVDFDGAAALEAMARAEDRVVDHAFLQTHCRRVLDGADRIVSWLQP